MNISTEVKKVKLMSVLDVSFDVGKDKLNCLFEYEKEDTVQIFQDEFRNTNKTIKEKLEEIQKMSLNMGYKHLRIICEPTGGYQEKLLRMARSLGMMTNYVNTEAVAKFRIVESNDTGKTDIKDPKIISTLAKLNKVLTHRVYSAEYEVLRKLNSLYESEEKKFVRQKCHLHKAIKNLFCDFSFKKDFLYGTTGRALMKTYKLNPYEMVKRGKQYFIDRMKRNVSNVRVSTLNRLWSDAKSSVLCEVPDEVLDAMLMEMDIHWQTFLIYEQNRDKIKSKMLKVLLSLRKENHKIPKAVKGLVTDFHIARIIAETGPLDDFNSHKQLLRYAGLNIRQYESCQMKGGDHICKKGRSLLRKTLSQVILATTKRDRFYGPYYHEKKSTGVKGNKIMVNLMRKFLKTFFGWYRSGSEFNPERVFRCESQIKQAA